MRIQYELSDSENAEIELKMKETSIKTKREFIQNAITLFIWAINEIKDGSTIGSLDKREYKYKEVIIPSLSFLKKT